MKSFQNNLYQYKLLIFVNMVFPPCNGYIFAKLCMCNLYFILITKDLARNRVQNGLREEKKD